MSKVQSARFPCREVELDRSSTSHRENPGLWTLDAFSRQAEP
jgi:hypothetical protein